MENKQIASALVRAQRAFGPALKTSTNPHFRSRYADLSACVEAVISGLNENGIALIQQTHDTEHGVCVETLFLHESGESLSAGRLSVPASKQDAQGYGSALTYARRYSLMAACGIAPEDDDGNAASRSIKPTPKAETPKATHNAPREAAPRMEDAPEISWDASKGDFPDWAKEVGQSLANNEESVNSYIRSKGWVAEHQSWRDLPDDAPRKRILSNTDKFLEVVNK